MSISKQLFLVFVLPFYLGIVFTMTYRARAKGADVVPAASSFKSSIIVPFEFAGADKWTSNGPGARVVAVAVDPNNRDTIYAGAVGGGIFKSTDGGSTWRNVLSATSINAIAIDPRNANIVYAGGPGFVGILKTTNGGGSWQSINNNLGVIGGVFALAIDPRNTATVYLGGGQSSVIKTIDGGASWNRTGAISSYVVALAVDPNNSNIVYAGNSAYKSTNGGVSWTPTSLSSGTVNALAIDPSNTSTIYAATIGALFKTTNGGSTWSNLTSSTFGATTFLSVVVDPANPATVYAATMISGVFKSTNGGATWSGFNNGLAGVAATSLAIDRSGRRVYLGTGGGVYVYDYSSVSSVSASSTASYSNAIASESIAALFGTGLASTTQSATALPLPTTLAGASVKIRDRVGSERTAPLFYASPSQINFQIPPGTATGAATANVINSGATIASGAVTISTIAPGIYSANSDGRGIAAGVALRVKANGAQSYEAITRFDPLQNKIVAVPIDLGTASDQVFLILFGTGIRFRSTLSAVTARIGGLASPVYFAGSQGRYVGLDQININLSRNLAGRGEVDVALTVNNVAANTVRVSIK